MLTLKPCVKDVRGDVLKSCRSRSKAELAAVTECTKVYELAELLVTLPEMIIKSAIATPLSAQVLIPCVACDVLCAVGCGFLNFQ